MAAGKVTLATGANPGAPSAGYARYYANASNQPCFVGADGVEHPLPWSPSVLEIVAKRKPGDQSVISNVSLQNDNDLSFAIAANEEWLAELSLDVGALLSTTGLQIGVSFPVGGQLAARTSLVPDVYCNMNYGALRTTANSTGMNFPTANELNVSNAAVKVSIWCLNGANAGTVQLQFCQSANTATNVTLRRGSALVAHRVA